MLLQLPGDIFRLAEVIAIDLHPDTGCAAYAVPLAYHAAAELREIAEDEPDLVGDIGGGTAVGSDSLGLGAEIDPHGNQVGTVALHACKGVVGVGLAEGVAEDLDLGHFRADAVIDPGGHFRRHVLRGTDRHLQRQGQTALVGAGEELGLGARGQQADGQHESRHGHDEHRYLMAHAPADQAAVSARDAVQHLVDRGEEDPVELAVVVAVVQHLGAHHRNQRQGGRRGDDHDDGDHPAHLLEDDAHQAAHHGQRQEDAEHGQRGSDDGDTDLGRAVDRRLLRLFAAFEVGGHVLEDHDGVVHHHTDGDGKGGHRDDVQRVTREEQVHQGCQQGDRDRQDHDQGAPPAAEEYEHDEHNHEERDHDGLEEGIDRILDVVRGVHDLGERDVVRQSGLEFLELLSDLADYLHGVGTGLLLDNDLGAADAVGVGFLRALLDTVLDAGDILEIDGIAPGITDDEVLELVRIAELLLDTEGVGVGSDIEVAGRDVAVLRADDGGDRGHVDPVCGHLVRVDIDMDFPLRGTGHGHGTDAGDTGERSRDIVIQNLVERRDAFGRRRGQDEDRHVVGAELIEDRRRSPVRKVRGHHVELVADVVGGQVDVRSVLELDGNDGDILPGLGGEVLEVADGVERVLQLLRQVVLDILGAGAGVCRDDHQDIGLNVREEVDRQTE